MEWGGGLYGQINNKCVKNMNTNEMFNLSHEEMQSSAKERTVNY